MSKPLPPPAPAVAGLRSPTARRRADRRGRQGPPLHGRRDRRGGARQPAPRSGPRPPPPPPDGWIAGAAPRRSEAARACAHGPGAQPARPGGDSGPRGRARPAGRSNLPRGLGGRRPRSSTRRVRLDAAPQLNPPISPLRQLGLLARPIDDLTRIKRTFGVKLNDVLLAASAGGVRAFLGKHGESPIRLKTMVPVNVRGSEVRRRLGNRISFMFVDLPCDEPRPGAAPARDPRWRRAIASGAGKPEGADDVVRSLGFVPSRSSGWSRV